MKTPTVRALWMLAGMMAIGPEVRSDEGVDQPRVLKADIIRLVTEDAARAAKPKSQASMPALTTTDVVQLDPLTVQGLPERRIKPVAETRVEKFVRTGVLWQSRGPDPRVRLWMKGDRGLMISFGF